MAFGKHERMRTGRSGAQAFAATPSRHTVASGEICTCEVASDRLNGYCDAM
jgi:hypothetical protein